VNLPKLISSLPETQLSVSEDESAQKSVVASTWDGCDGSDARPESLMFLSHPIRLLFYDLRQNSSARVALDPEKNARWGNVDRRNGLVGVQFIAPRGNTLSLSTFSVNQLELLIETSSACPELHVRLYLRTLESSFSGRADLPSGTSLTIESSVDRTSLIERGVISFSVKTPIIAGDNIKCH
jgi:hypothetical protein